MTTKNSKDVILLNCQEVPETICVETRFINRFASKQIKYDNLYRITNNGNFELMSPEDDVVPAKSIVPLSKTTITPGGAVHLSHLSQFPGTMTSFGTSLSNQNNSNLSAVHNLHSQLPGTMASFGTSLNNQNNSPLSAAQNLNPQVIVPMPSFGPSLTNQNNSTMPAIQNLNSQVSGIISSCGTNQNNTTLSGAQNLNSKAPRTMAPFGTSLTNQNNSTLSAVQNLNSSFGTSLTKQSNSNLSAVQNPNFPALMPSSNYLPLQTVDLSTSVLPATTMLSVNNSNVPAEQFGVSTFNKISIATQCSLDEELEDFDVQWPEMIQDSLENPTDLEIEKDEFLKYVLENSTQHKTCKECLICGEICKSNKYFYGHMAIHLGPKVLCYKCGKYLDHKKLFSKHKCRQAQQLEKAFLQCPHHNCSVKAISPLELFDHINEHANNRIYRCSACRKAFCTSQEYLRHLLIRAKCYTCAKRKRVSFYGLQSQRERSCRVRVFTLHTYKKSTTLVKTFLSKRVAKRGFCKICLRYFAHNSVYNRHRIKCVGKFRKRLIRKKN